MHSPVEEIKARLDIVELIQSYVRLQKAGINFKATCPFHSEKTASFFVSPTRQIWHCFGCGRGGDAFKFVMEIEGHDFPEALRMLASRAGVVLKREDPRVRSERNRLYDLCEEAAKLFEATLIRTPAVRNYLRERGVAEETIREFRIGFAPARWDFLLKTLGVKGFRTDELEKAGLVIRSEDKSSWYDRFRGRIMFPIADGNGRVIGFGGRVFQEDPNRPEAKYVNTPNTPIYDKSRVLYGFDKAKQEIRAKNQVVVVEGYMDCLMSHQAQVMNTIAVSGTALTPPQIKILRRLCSTMVSSFDTDAAGESATRRSLELASQFEFERRIALIPSGKDPADAVRENPELWRAAVESAKPVVAFYFEKILQTHDPRTAEGKKTIAAALLPFVAELANEIEKAHWVSELGAKLGINEESVWKELNRIAPRGGATSRAAEPSGEPAPSSLPTRRDLLEERFLALLSILQGRADADEFEKRRLVFVSPARQEIFEALRAGTAAIQTHLQPTLELLTFKAEILAGITPDLESEFRACARELEKETIRHELLRLGEEIRDAEGRAPSQAVEPLLQSFRELSEKLKILS